MSLRFIYGRAGSGRTVLCLNEIKTRMNSANEVFEEQYEKGETDFFELLECYGANRDDQALQDIVLNLYSFIQSSPLPEDWLIKHTESINIADDKDFSVTLWGMVLLESVKLELEGLKAIITRAIKILQHAVGLEKYKAVYIEDLANIEALLKLLDYDGQSVWDNLLKALNDIEYKRLPNAAKDADKEAQEIVKKIRDDVKFGIRNLRD